MEARKRIFWILGCWLTLISGLHAYLNVDWVSLLNEELPEQKRRMNVAYIPVT